MRDNRSIEDLLRKSGEELKIPKKLEAGQMRRTLEEYEKTREKKRYGFPVIRYSVLASAACFFLTAGILFGSWQAGRSLPGGNSLTQGSQKQEEAEHQDPATETSETEQELPGLSDRSYEEIYACLSENWKADDAVTRGSEKEEMAFTEETDDLAAAGAKMQSKESDAAFGKTNTQAEQIDEADQIKNDGRYLYQIAAKRQEGESGTDAFRTGIQILDTEGGLAETAFIDDFDCPEEFYVWEDLLIVIENKYYDYASLPAVSKKGAFMEDLEICGVFSGEQAYHEISVYQIADRSRPRKLKTFTLQGRYESSRISEGYFYEISRFTAGPGEGAQDYDAYIPSLDGRRMEADRILCPADPDGSDYLVLVSVDLSNPVSLTDSRAVLAGSGTYYVSSENIYVAWYQSVYEREITEAGKIQDTTRLLRFFYRKGRFYAQASGQVPGNVESSFSMDEYEGNLRIAVTVQEYEAKEIRDDRTGERLGFDYGEARENNALYILDPSLAVCGKAEGLAEGEIIRSVRFLGNTGYIVTFRRTDPLFAVDLSDPEHPEVLGELKVSGFSEYLHVYGEGLLLGIGMEADEESGREEGMKLSMFDISDPAELKEVSRFRLEDYDYSEALWDHRAVLIDTGENILGFGAEGWRNGEHYADYFLFSFEDGVFVQTLKADARLEDGSCGRARGTFIGDVFYLLFENGTARAYERKTGGLLEEVPVSRSDAN